MTTYLMGYEYRISEFDWLDQELQEDFEALSVALYKSKNVPEGNAFGLERRIGFSP